MVGYLKKTSPHMAERVTRYKEREPLMEAMGVDQFALYLQHDAKSETLAAYGDHVLPAVNVRKAAKA